MSTDATFSALAHPVRRQMLDRLLVGPTTVSDLADIVLERVGSCVTPPVSHLCAHCDGAGPSAPSASKCSRRYCNGARGRSCFALGYRSFASKHRGPDAGSHLMVGGNVHNGGLRRHHPSVSRVGGLATGSSLSRHINSKNLHRIRKRQCRVTVLRTLSSGFEHATGLTQLHPPTSGQAEPTCPSACRTVDTGHRWPKRGRRGAARLARGSTIASK